MSRVKRSTSSGIKNLMWMGRGLFLPVLTQLMMVSQETVQRDAWGAALARAKGERVLDDPKRLRRSIKTDAKAKEKRVGAWKERAGKQKEAQAAKQQKCASLPCACP